MMQLIVADEKELFSLKRKHAPSTVSSRRNNHFISLHLLSFPDHVLPLLDF